MNIRIQVSGRPRRQGAICFLSDRIPQFTFARLRRPEHIAASDLQLRTYCKQFAAHQECELLCKAGVDFNFYAMVACQAQDSLEAAFLTRHQVEEIIGCRMAASEHAVLPSAVHTIDRTLLSSRK